MEPDFPRVSPDSGPCLLVARDDLAQLADLAIDGVAIFGVVTVGDAAIGLIDASQRQWDMMTAPMLCLGLIALGPDSLAQLERVRRVLESWSSSDIPSPILVERRRLASSLPMLLSASLVGRVRSYAAHVTRLSRELFRLRAAHEDMLNAFATVENFIGSSGIQPCNMTFESLPDEGETIAANEVAAITQVLPVSTMGLSVIQIHVGDWTTVDKPFGGIGVELRTVEDHESHGSWSVPLDRLKPGWITLALSGGLTGLQRTPELVIRPLGGLGILPPLSLGPLQPLPAFRPRSGEAKGPLATIGRRSLALRTWSGIPGVRPPAIDAAVDLMRREDEAGVRDVVVPFTLLKGARSVMSQWAPSFAPVDYLPALRGLLCHPPPVGVTWAEIRDFPANEQPFRLSVRAVVRSPEANPIEFGFAFSTLAPEAACKMLDGSAGMIEKSDMVFSGWRIVTHDEPAMLSLLIHGFAGRSGRLYFGTRMASDSGNDFAWASFYNLRKTMLDIATVATARETAMPQDAIKAGASDPVILLDGVPLALDTLEGVTDTQEPWLPSMPTVLYDHDRRGIFCHPPPAGVALARISGLSARDNLKLLARLHLAHDKSQAVEFALIASCLEPDEVMARLDAGAADRNDEDFVCSGWRSVAYDHDVLLDLNLLPLRIDRADIYMATRMGDQATSNDFAWAYFMDLRAVTQARRSPGGLA